MQLLSRDSQDCVRFTHKSFMEYYAAVYMRMLMSGSSGAQDLLTSRQLTDEVAFFLGDSIATAPNAASLTDTLVRLYDRLSSLPSPSPTCIQNLLNVLSYSRKTVSPIKNAKVDLLVYRKL